MLLAQVGLLPLGSAWTDAVAQEHWTSSSTDHSCKEKALPEGS
jgi:hypothetical protein